MTNYEEARVQQTDEQLKKFELTAKNNTGTT